MAPRTVLSYRHRPRHTRLPDSQVRLHQIVHHVSFRAVANLPGWLPRSAPDDWRCGRGVVARGVASKIALSVGVRGRTRCTEMPSRSRARGWTWPRVRSWAVVRRGRSPSRLPRAGAHMKAS